MITLLLLIPIIGSILLIPINENEEEPKQTPSLTLVYNSVAQRENEYNSLAPSLLLKQKYGALALAKQLKMKQIALTTSLINLFISLFMWYQFDSNITQYQFVSEFNHLNLYHLNFGVDSISIYFVLLTTFVTPIALLSNYTNITNNLKFFLISFLILESLQICAFVSLDLLLFYIFFESAKWSGISLSLTHKRGSAYNYQTPGTP